MQAFTGLRKAAGGGLGEILGTFGIGEGLTYISSNLVNTIGNMGIIKGLGMSIAKVMSTLTGKTIEYSTTANIGFGKVCLAILAIVAAIKSLQAVGLEITNISDETPVPHNGCRPPKKRRG